MKYENKERQNKLEYIWTCKYNTNFIKLWKLKNYNNFLIYYNFLFRIKINYNLKFSFSNKISIWKSSIFEFL